VKTLVFCRAAEGISREQIAPHAAAELVALRELKSRGVLLKAYSPGGPGAVPISETKTTSAIDELIGSLPLHRAGLIDVETIQLQPFSL
jgi:hypothetical protein